jgi:CO/xanthine dehydrogenase Mo-binding subunit
LIGTPKPHVASKFLASGGAEFVGDIKLPAKYLQAVFVTSSVAHANIKSINVEEALKVEG